MKKPAKPNPHATLKPGDRVIATNGAGLPVPGYLHHLNGRQFYVLPGADIQPFYAFPSDITATGGRQPEFVPVDWPLGIDTAERQRVYVAHRQRRLTP